jgi:SAM-dependent methyltransferase
MSFLFPTALLLLAALLGTFAYGAWSAAPYLPMWSVDMQRVLRVANIQSRDRIYELGCGDGRLVVACARAGAQVTGFEVALIPYLVARARCVFGRLPNAHVRYADFWKADFSQADVLFFFLTPKIYKRMQEKCERECTPGTRVVAYVWPFDEWSATAVDRVEGKPDIYVYTMK